MIDTDIDIDFADRDAAIAVLDIVQASMNMRGERCRHSSGVYFQNVPVDPVDGYCSFEYERAAELGYIKIDFLNNSIYLGVRDEDHLLSLLSTEPIWELLEDSDVVSQLSHIREHFSVVEKIKPRSIEDLAVVIALIRPGKKHLLEKTRAEIDAEIWTTGHDGYQFKKAHAISFSTSIVVQLNLMVEEISK